MCQIRREPQGKRGQPQGKQGRPQESQAGRKNSPWLNFSTILIMRALPPRAKNISHRGAAAISPNWLQAAHDPYGAQGQSCQRDGAMLEIDDPLFRA